MDDWHLSFAVQMTISPNILIDIQKGCYCCKFRNNIEQSYAISEQGYLECRALRRRWSTYRRNVLRTPLHFVRILHLLFQLQLHPLLMDGTRERPPLHLDKPKNAHSCFKEG